MSYARTLCHGLFLASLGCANVPDEEATAASDPSADELRMTDEDSRAYEAELRRIHDEFDGMTLILNKSAYFSGIHDYAFETAGLTPNVTCILVNARTTKQKLGQGRSLSRDQRFFIRQLNGWRFESSDAAPKERNLQGIRMYLDHVRTDGENAGESYLLVDCESKRPGNKMPPASEFVKALSSPQSRMMLEYLRDDQRPSGLPAPDAGATN